jgi:hypothetical protein
VRDLRFESVIEPVYSSNHWVLACLKKLQQPVILQAR